MSRIPDALNLFFDDPSFVILLWAVPVHFKAMILMEYEDAIILTALMMVAVVLGVLVLNRTLFLMMMMMVAASTFGIGSLVVGIWALMLGCVATARELAHGERRGTTIEERRIVRGEGQERSNDSTEERTENISHNERRRSSDSTEERTKNLSHNECCRSSAITEQRIAQTVRDTMREAIREERSEMEAQLKKVDDLKIAVDRLLFVLRD